MVFYFSTRYATGTGKFFADTLGQEEKTTSHIISYMHIDMTVVCHTYLLLYSGIQWNLINFNCRYCITSLLGPVTLPFSPAAGQFNLPVPDQWMSEMTLHAEPAQYRTGAEQFPVERLRIGRRLFLTHGVCTYRTQFHPCHRSQLVPCPVDTVRCGTGTQAH
jgi:hypothetical protein